MLLQIPKDLNKTDCLPNDVSEKIKAAYVAETNRTGPRDNDS
jgi:hypothetical protein